MGIVSDNTSESVRANVYIRATEAEGYTVCEGAHCKTFTDPHEASDNDERFREAYKRLKAGVSALAGGRIRTTDTRQLTPFCRALSGKFECEGKETRISIFTEQAEDKEERTFAVQVTHRSETGQYVEFYSTHARQRRLIDPFIASSSTFLVTAEDEG